MGVVRGNNLLRNQFLFCSFSSFAAQSYYNPISAFLTITLLSLNLALSLIVSSPSPPPIPHDENTNSPRSICSGRPFEITGRIDKLAAKIEKHITTITRCRPPFQH